MTGIEKQEMKRLMIEYWRELRDKYPGSDNIPDVSWRPMAFQLAVIALAEEEYSFDYNRWFWDNEKNKQKHS